MTETPCEALFERLAETDPARLLDMLKGGGLEPALLTFAAEIAGQRLPSELVVPVLLELLKHPSPLVREGAIYGLAAHPGIADTFRELAESDPSPGVRTAALDMLSAL